jgi:co-chaperonin GroES (HSP10)
MRYQLLRDFYLVFVSDIWESSTTKSGLITTNTALTAKQNAVEEVEDRGEFKRRYGYVIEVPVSFSDTALRMIDPGAPAPRRYISHDWIQMMANSGQRGYRPHENPSRLYYPSTFEEYETVKISDVAKRVDVNVNDLVYFEHTSTDMERYMGEYEYRGLKGYMFSIQANEILCVAKKSPIFINHVHYAKEKIFPQGGWVFVKLNMESWEEITLPGTKIVVKMAPEAKPLQGKIIAAQREDLTPGLDILFERDADAPITIDGEDMTCMSEDDVLAIIKPK